MILTAHIIEIAPASKGEGYFDRWTVISSAIEVNNNYFEDNILAIGREQFFNGDNSGYFANWGKIGVMIISDLCNSLTDSFIRGLKILVSGVQISVLA